MSTCGNLPDDSRGRDAWYVQTGALETEAMHTTAHPTCTHARLNAGILVTRHCNQGNTVYTRP